MLKKWFEIIFDHRISLRERMFRIVKAGDRRGEGGRHIGRGSR